MGRDIEIINLVKIFDSNLLVLDHLNVSLLAGEFVSILGPSGCGKSTLLNLVAGLQTPSSGSIEIHDSLKPIGFVFQDPHLLPWRNVEENIEVPLEFQGISESLRKKRLNEALDLVGLEGFRKSYPSQLSGGMKMRVSLARALATQPKILLLDEPFAALDEPLRQRLHLELLRLRDELDLTILLVTHSISEAIFLSNRLLVLSNRPAKIVKDERVNLPKERIAQMKWSSQVLSQASEISDLIASFEFKETRDSK